MDKPCNHTYIKTDKNWVCLKCSKLMIIKIESEYVNPDDTEYPPHNLQPNPSEEY